MAGKRSLATLVAITVTALIAMCAEYADAYPYRVCTFKGTVIDHGWRTMTVKSNSQCAQVNVSWRTKFIPNRRPCIGERVAVDFALEDGYMKAVKVVSLSPLPASVECYPPPPPSGTTCRTTGERPEAECTPAQPICDRKPPPHVADPSWSPAPKKPEKPPAAAKPKKKPPTPSAEVEPGKPVEEPSAPAKEEIRKTQPITEKRFKSLTGEVVASSPKSLSIRVTEEGEAAEVINVSVGLKTKFIPFRRPAVGEKVKVEFRDENGGKFGYTVQVIQ